jgi:hypothetical protein
MVIRVLLSISFECIQQGTRMDTGGLDEKFVTVLLLLFLFYFGLTRTFLLMDPGPRPLLRHPIWSLKKRSG